MEHTTRNKTTEHHTNCDWLYSRYVNNEWWKRDETQTHRLSLERCGSEHKINTIEEMKELERMSVG